MPGLCTIFLITGWVFLKPETWCRSMHILSILSLRPQSLEGTMESDSGIWPPWPQTCTCNLQSIGLWVSTRNNKATSHSHARKIQRISPSSKMLCLFMSTWEGLRVLLRSPFFHHSQNKTNSHTLTHRPGLRHIPLLNTITVFFSCCMWLAFAWKKGKTECKYTSEISKF